MIVLLRGCSIGIFLVLSMKLYVECRQLLAGRLLLALLLCTIAYLFEPFLTEGTWLEWGVRLLTAMVTPLYWLFASALFLDWDYRQRSMGTRRVIISACYMAVIVLTMVFERGSPERFELTEMVIFNISYLFRLAILTAALVVTLAHWRQDMIEARRRLRLLLVFTGVSMTILKTVVELGYAGVDMPAMLTLIYAALLLILSLWVSVWLEFDGLTAIAGQPTPKRGDELPESGTTATVQANDRRLLALNDFIINQKGYRKTGLSIGRLGKELIMREHVLRKLINQGLGYRNFSDFLNHYRIEDVASRLADPSQTHLPILTIALDTGYASLAPFNRAFKEKMGQTPSEYRRQQSAGVASPL
jgi:AraC-like DNA-binding protein